MKHNEPFFNSEERDKMISRCEEMLSSNKPVYFDIIEFENLIDFYIEDNKLGKAMQIIDIAVSQHPFSTEIQVKKAKLLIERNRSSEAIDLINKLLALDSSSVDLNLMKGTCLVDMGKLDEAQSIFKSAIDMAIGADIEETYYNSALAFIDNGLYKQAIPFLEKAHSLNPESTLILYDLAYSYDRIHDFQQSIETYKKYLDIDPYSDNAWYNLGIVYNKANMYTEAIDAFDYAIAINDNYASAYFNKANTLANWEKYSMAISIYSEYLELEPENAIGLYYIGECYEKLNEFEMALDFYNKTLKVDRKFSDAWFGIGIIKYYQDDFEEAKSFMEKAIELDSENAEYWLSYGNVVRALDVMPKETLNAYKRSTQINPYDPEPWLYYADALKQYASLELSIEVLKKAQSYIDDDAEILFTLAAYYYDSNMLDIALKHYLRAADIDYERASLFYSNCKPTEDDKEMFLELTKKNKGNI